MTVILKWLSRTFHSKNRYAVILETSHWLTDRESLLIAEFPNK